MQFILGQKPSGAPTGQCIFKNGTKNGQLLIPPILWPHLAVSNFIRLIQPADSLKNALLIRPDTPPLHLESSESLSLFVEFFASSIMDLDYPDKIFIPKLLALGYGSR